MGLQLELADCNQLVRSADTAAEDGHCNIAVPPGHRGEGVLITKQTSLADRLRRNICITSTFMHPIAGRVSDYCGDEHDRVPVKRVWFAAIELGKGGVRLNLIVFQSKNQRLTVKKIY